MLQSQNYDRLGGSGDRALLVCFVIYVRGLNVGLGEVTQKEPFVVLSELLHFAGVCRLIINLAPYTCKIN